MKRKRTTNTVKKNAKIEKLMVMNPHAAGIDVGQGEHWVCVPKTSYENNVRQFGTYTTDLKKIADWLCEYGVTTVIMESTGVYWIPLYEVLEERGFDLNLCNAKHAKNVPGRTKTDRYDCK